MKRLRALKTAWERRRYGSSNAELDYFWGWMALYKILDLPMDLRKESRNA